MEAVSLGAFKRRKKFSVGVRDQIEILAGTWTVLATAVRDSTQLYRAESWAQRSRRNRGARGGYLLLRGILPASLVLEVKSACACWPGLATRRAVIAGLQGLPLAAGPTAPPEGSGGQQATVLRSIRQRGQRGQLDIRARGISPLRCSSQHLLPRPVLFA
jgi:hypothetical protein